MIIRAALWLGAGSGQRGLSTGQTTFSRNAIRKMLLQEDCKKRKKSSIKFSFPTMDGPSKGMVKTGSQKAKLPKDSIRLQNLNKVYLDKITDILSTGELAAELYGRGLELSQVRIHPDMQGINVYWVTSGNAEQDHHTQEILNRHVKAVRHELSALRIIGHSPPLTFFRDDRLFKLKEVERLLGIADYGEDFEPTNPSHHLMSAPPTLAMPLDANVKTAIEGLERADSKEDQPDPFEIALTIASEPPQEDTSDPIPTLPNDLPPMRGDVLGVNTSKICTMIQQSMKRARAEHRKKNETGSLSNPIDYNPQDLIDPVIINRKQEIQEWANRYTQMQRKEARKKNRDAALLSYPGDLTEDLEDQETEVEWEEEWDFDEKLE